MSSFLFLDSGIMRDISRIDLHPGYIILLFHNFHSATSLIIQVLFSISTFISHLLIFFSACLYLTKTNLIILGWDRSTRLNDILEGHDLAVLTMTRSVNIFGPKAGLPHLKKSLQSCYMIFSFCKSYFQEFHNSLFFEKNDVVTLNIL